MAKILVIEDELSLQKAMVDVLNITGYEALGASDGEEGLQMARLEKPDLILLDIILPKKNGFDVLAELKKDSRTKDIPVIVCTGFNDMNHVERLFNWGASDYIIKPFDNERVVQKVKNILDGDPS